MLKYINLSLGCILTISEILPFIKKLPGNGIIHYMNIILQKFIKTYDDEYLLNENNTDINITNELTNENKSENTSELTSELTSERTSELTNKLTNENKSEEMNHHTGEVIDIINEQTLELKGIILNLIESNSKLVEGSDFVVTCEMILQHLQELQRKFIIQNNSLIELINKSKNEVNEKIMILLEKILKNQESIEIDLLKNKESEQLERILKNQEFMLTNFKKKKNKLFF